MSALYAAPAGVAVVRRLAATAPPPARPSAKAAVAAPARSLRVRAAMRRAVDGNNVIS